MSASAAILPCVWAFAGAPLSALPEPRFEAPAQLPQDELACYRKYTESILQRYMRMTLEAGKVPSLLGQELFHGRVSSYQVEGFEDVVIFIADVEHCLEKLTQQQQLLILRISIQEYTVGEVATELRVVPRTIIRRYGWALDRLTELFLKAEMLEVQNWC